MAVVDGVAEAVAAVEVRIRRVAERAIRMDDQAAVGGIGMHRHDERISVCVEVVGQHARSGHVQRLVLIDAVAVVGGLRCVVDRSDSDGHVGGVTAPVAVVDRVDSSERVALRENMVDARGRKVFSNRLQRTAKHFGDTAISRSRTSARRSEIEVVRSGRGP